MNITVYTKGFSLTDALNEKVESRFESSLSAFADKIQRVEVTLADVNGPKGGEDKICRVHVHMDGLNPIIVEDLEEDMYGAINACASRAKRTVKRQIEKTRHITRRAS